MINIGMFKRFTVGDLQEGSENCVVLPIVFPVSNESGEKFTVELETRGYWPVAMRALGLGRHKPKNCRLVFMRSNYFRDGDFSIGCIDTSIRDPKKFCDYDIDVLVFFWSRMGAVKCVIKRGYQKDTYNFFIEGMNSPLVFSESDMPFILGKMIFEQRVRYRD